MSPREYLGQVVRPNVDEFHANYGSVRHAHNAIAAVDSLAAHIFVWCQSAAPALVDGVADDSGYRTKLATANSDFALLRDLAKAQKHVRLDRGTPQVSRADQISARSTGYGEATYGDGRYGGPLQVVVDIAPGSMRYVEGLVDQALSFLEVTLTSAEIDGAAGTALSTK